MLISGIEMHYDNTPMQYTAIFHSCKKGDGSLIFAHGNMSIFMLFLVIFEDDKSDNFLRGDKSFRTLKRTKSRQKQNK